MIQEAKEADHKGEVATDVLYGNRFYGPWIYLEWV